MEPIISVIVPVYNSEKYVGQCIESLINQTFKQIEFLLIDDGSTDSSGVICDLYASKDDRITVVHKQNGGLVSARKKGMSLARGNIIGYVDGDDWIEKTYFENAYNALIENDADIVVSGFKRDLFEKSDIVLNTFKSGLYEGDNLLELKKNCLSCGSFFNHGVYTFLWNKIFKKDLVYNKQLSVDDSIIIGEDASVVYPAIFDSNKIVITNDCSYHYRQREDSILKRKYSFSYDFLQIKSAYSYFEKLLSNKDYQKYGFGNQIKDYLVWMYIFRLFGDTELYELNQTMMPYSKDFYGKTISLYCAGNYGQQLYKRLEQSDFCEIIDWVDVDYWLYRRMGLNVNDPSQLNNNTDFVVIASINSEQANEIKKQLSLDGIDEKKIITIDASKKDAIFDRLVTMLENGVSL